MALGGSPVPIAMESGIGDVEATTCACTLL